MKNIAILGSTGSIGVQTLNVIDRLVGEFCVKALSADTNIQLLLKQIEKYHPHTVAVTNAEAYAAAKSLFPANVCVLSGKDALKELAALNDVDIVVVSVVGMCGLPAVMSALNSGHQVALANKESLVAGGELVMDAVKKSGKEILPIDSEHSAVWQCLRCGRREDLKRIILTASGGAFFGKSKDFLKTVTPDAAIKHPNWKMGKKISVDSATMMNKGLEIIEARWLFDTQNIDYVIHPQSIIHSMVEFCDGSIIAQMSKPNMELPIQEALTYPARSANYSADFLFDKELSFFKPDETNFPLPRLAKTALNIGGNAPCIINSANEACVKLYLTNRIAFTDINIIIEKILQSGRFIKSPTLDDIYFTHNEIFDKLMRDYKNYLE